MKKALIAVSVAAGLAGIAHAENTTTLYGAIGFETEVNKDGGIKDTLKDNTWDLNRSTFKWGIKGTEDLNNGLQAFYTMEFGGVDQTKKAFLGFKGSFGTVTLGMQDSLYKKMVNRNDIFQNTYFDNVTFLGATGGGTLDKAISYVSPDFSGFHFGVAGVLDGSHSLVRGPGSIANNYDGTYAYGTDSKSFVAYQAGVWYDQNGFFAGLGYGSIQNDRFNTEAVLDRTGNEIARRMTTKVSDGTSEAIGGSVGYSNDQFKAGFGVEHLASNGEVYNLAGEYYYGPNTFRAGFGLLDPKEGKDVYTYALGYQYNFSKRTYTYVEGQYVDMNEDNVDNGYTVHIGIRHDF